MASRAASASEILSITVSPMLLTAASQSVRRSLGTQTDDDQACPSTCGDGLDANALLHRRLYQALCSSLLGLNHDLRLPRGVNHA